MQFKNMEIGQCFRIVGDSDVLMKVAPDLYVRAVREVSSGSLLCQSIGTVNLIVQSCKCNQFFRILSETERRVIEEVISKNGIDVDFSHVFERW